MKLRQQPTHPSQENLLLIKGLLGRKDLLPIVLFGPQGDGGWIAFWSLKTENPAPVGAG